MRLILSAILVSEFFIGFYISAISTEFIKIILTFLGFLIFFVQNLILIKLNSPLSLRKKAENSTLHTINSLFSFIIGFSIPLMESYSRNNFAFTMLPLLVILTLIIIDKSQKEIKDNISEIKQEFDRPVIEFEGKKFVFSTKSLILFAIGAPLSALLIYYLFDWEPMYWLHEIVVKQTIFFLNLFFNMGASASYNPALNYHWSFVLTPGNIYFETFCTGIQAICVFAGIIIFIPHSQDKKTSKDIIWRKTKSLVVSSFIFYIVNIIRMLIQLELYHIGYPWESIHVSISAASSFIAAIIILLLHKWIPEFIISIIYTGALIKKKIRI